MIRRLLGRSGSRQPVHVDDGELMALLDRELTPEDTERVNSHLAECERCTKEFESLRRAVTKVSDTLQPLPPSVFAQSKEELFKALPERLMLLPAEREIRDCLGRQLSVRVRTSPDQVRLAIQTLLGSPHPVPTMRFLPHFLWFAAGFYFLLAFGVWLHWLAWGEWSANGPGDWRYMNVVFGAPYKFYLIFTAAAATVLSFGAMCQFEKKHPLYPAWLMLFVAAGCRLLGRAVGAVPSVLSLDGLEPLRSAGQLIAGPVSLFALGFGLLVAYQVYRSVGLSLRLEVIDAVLMSIGAVFTIRHLAQIVAILAQGNLQQPIVVLNWFSDPALLMTLTVAVPLRRVAISQGGGLVPKCWSAMTAGALLTFLGNFMIYLENYGYLPWPWSTMSWLVWIPASAAFTLGPAYQFAANRSLLFRSELAQAPQV